MHKISLDGYTGLFVSFWLALPGMPGRRGVGRETLAETENEKTREDVGVTGHVGGTYSMKTPTFTWEQSKMQYGSGYNCRMGKWRIGGWCWNVVSNEPHYSVYCGLPGFKDCLGAFETKEIAREYLEKAALRWFAGLFKEPVN